MTTEFISGGDVEQPLLSVATLRFTDATRFDDSTEHNLLDEEPICPLTITDLVATKVATGETIDAEVVNGVNLRLTNASVDIPNTAVSGTVAEVLEVTFQVTPSPFDGAS